MNIEIDPHSGFCYGVVCAIEMAEKARLLFMATQNKSGISRCYSVTGICYWHKFEDTLALKTLERALEIYEETKEARNQ